MGVTEKFYKIIYIKRMYMNIDKDLKTIGNSGCQNRSYMSFLLRYTCM